MSGHSKWDTIRRKKELNDLKKGKAFTKFLYSIVHATKEGGPNPKSNFLLKNAIDRAKSFNVSKDAINKAIEKGFSNKSSSQFMECLYEAYGPEGILVIIKCITDNKNRAISNLRSTIERNGGRIVDNGTLSWQFQRLGVMTIKKDNVEDFDSFEIKLIDIQGVTDYEYDDDYIYIYTEVKDLKAVSATIEKNYSVDTIKISMIPKMKIEVSDDQKVERFIEAIEELDDVDDIYLNI